MELIFYLIAIIPFATVLSTIKIPYIHTPLSNNPILFFEHLDNIRLTTDKWTIYTYINTREILNIQDKAQLIFKNNLDLASIFVEIYAEQSQDSLKNKINSKCLQIRRTSNLINIFKKNLSNKTISRENELFIENSDRNNMQWRIPTFYILPSNFKNILIKFQKFIKSFKTLTSEFTCESSIFLKGIPKNCKFQVKSDILPQWIPLIYKNSWLYVYVMQSTQLIQIHCSNSTQYSLYIFQTGKIKLEPTCENVKPTFSLIRKIP